MGVIDHIDGESRRIYLSIDTVNNDVHPIEIYKEMRALRAQDEELRKYDVFLTAYGNIPKGGGKATERYVQCNDGTRIIPYDTNHILTITGTLITDDGQEGVACIDRSTLSITSIVDINYVPPQVEVITVISTGGLTTQNMDDIRDKVWSKDIDTITDTRSIGWHVKNKLVTVAKMIGLLD